MAHEGFDYGPQLWNMTCDYEYVPSAVENIESLSVFGISLLSFGALLSTLTLYFAVDACHNVIGQKISSQNKHACVTILAVNPIASFCSLLALALPRIQLLSEGVTQIALTLAFCRLYELLVEIGLQKMRKPPEMRLKVGPCCCWPCLPFPSVQITEGNLSRLRLLVQQFPIVQSLVYCICLGLALENSRLEKRYGVWIQPFATASILLAIYGLTVAVKSFQEVAPEEKLHHKWIVTQLVLLFSKLQAFIVKNLPNLDIFPCNPPITPQIYANVTYNSLMLIEMLLLSCAARHVYYVEPEDEKLATVETTTTDRPEDKRAPTAAANTNESKQPVVQLTAITA